LRARIIDFPVPAVRQSGQTHWPARSKLPRKFGKSMHQQRSLPAGAPQLKRTPQSSQTNFCITTPSMTGKCGNIAATNVTGLTADDNRWMLFFASAVKLRYHSGAA